MHVQQYCFLIIFRKNYQLYFIFVDSIRLCFLHNICQPKSMYFHVFYEHFSDQKINSSGPGTGTTPGRPGRSSPQRRGGPPGIRPGECKLVPGTRGTAPGWILSIFWRPKAASNKQRFFESSKIDQNVRINRPWGAQGRFLEQKPLLLASLLAWILKVWGGFVGLRRDATTKPTII